MDFFSAYDNTIMLSGIIGELVEHKRKYEYFKIMVTGHSMGGTMAAFCGLDLAVTKIIPSPHFTLLYLLCFLLM
ncbi:putative fungal lipase-like domain, alpha/Beta hydrolase [Helianthus anomalus]